MAKPKAACRIKIHAKVVNSTIVCNVISTKKTILKAQSDWTLKRFRSALSESMKFSNDNTFQIKCGDESWDFLPDKTLMQQLVSSDVCLTISHTTNIKKKKKKNENKGLYLDYNAAFTNRFNQFPISKSVNVSPPKAKKSRPEFNDSPLGQYSKLENPSNNLVNIILDPNFPPL
jgi:hypothetical protein